MNIDKYNRGNAKIVGVILVTILVVGVFVYWKSQNSKSNEILKTNTGEVNEAPAPKVLTRKNSTYSEFNQKDYERALSEGKIVYLEFYANWCPICRAQEPDLIEGFNKLSRADVAGFRVNYKDDQTDENEKALATKYKIPYQHHKIVLKNKQVVIDSSDTWDAQTLVFELSKL